MKSTKAANRYAQSLLDLAKENGELNRVKDDMMLVRDTVAASKDLALMLTSPIIKSEVKKKVIESIFSSSVTNLSMMFLHLLADKGRERMLEDIADAFINLYWYEKGIINAEVVSAVPMSAEWKADLAAAFTKTGKSIEFTESVDPSLLGGLRVKVGDQLIDATLRRKLNELKQEISN